MFIKSEKYVNFVVGVEVLVIDDVCVIFFFNFFWMEFFYVFVVVDVCF